MSKSEKIAKYSIMAGAIYFMGIAIFHLLGVKVPGLYIYYSIPSTVYQDQIISFMAFGWAVFFYTAAQNLNIFPSILVAGSGALAALININLSNDFAALQPGATTTPFWIQTFILLLYLAWLIVYYLKVRSKI